MGLETRSSALWNKQAAKHSHSSFCEYIWVYVLVSAMIFIVQSHYVWMVEFYKHCDIFISLVFYIVLAFYEARIVFFFFN